MCGCSCPYHHIRIEPPILPSSRFCLTQTCAENRENACQPAAEKPRTCCGLLRLMTHSNEADADALLRRTGDDHPEAHLVRSRQGSLGRGKPIMGHFDSNARGSRSFRKHLRIALNSTKKMIGRGVRANFEIDLWKIRLGLDHPLRRRLT